MTAAEFQKKRSRFQAEGTAACQGHFADLCRLLGQATVDLTNEQILGKLLALNLERAAEAAKAAKVKKPKTSRERKADEIL